jgi:heme exporter protein C
MTSTNPRWWTAVGRALWALALLLVLASLWAVRYLAPVEEQMGLVQKIFYVHVPSAMATLVGFGITFGASIAYLATKQWYWDAIAASACEVALVFATVVLVTGPLWARSAWNTWWTWEPRLTSFLILWLLYAGYHVVRASVSEASKRTISSVLGIILFVNLPIVWKAVEWWRGSLHPQHVTMTAEMRTTLLISMAAWFVFLAAAFQARLKLEWLREAAAERAAAEEPEVVQAGEGRP